MKQESIDWLNGLVPQAEAQVKGSARELKRQAILLKVATDIESLRSRLIENSQIHVTDKQGNSQRVVNYETRDQTTEFDIDEMRDGYALGKMFEPKTERSDEQDDAIMDTLDIQKHLETQRFVEILIRQIEEAKDDGDEPLFDKKELIEEIYQPLVRQGIMPETFVPDEFSQTKEMLENTLSEYAKRLESEDEKGFWDENGDLIMTSINSAIGMAGAGTTMAAGLSVMDNAPDASWGPQEWRSGLLDSGEASMSATVTGYIGWAGQLVSWGALDIPGDKDEIGEKINPKQVPDRVRLAPSLAQGIASGLACQLGTALSGVGMGIAASSAFGSVINVSAIAKELAEEEFTQANVEAVRDTFQKAYKSLVQRIDPGDHRRTTKALKEAGTVMADKFGSALPVAEITAALHVDEDEKLDGKQIIQSFLQAGAEAAAEGKTSLDTLLQDETTRRKIRKQINDKLSEDFLKAQEEEDQKAQHELDELKVIGDVRTEASRIDKKIAALVRERQTLKWAFGLAGLGVQVASQVLAPLAIAGAAAGVAQNLIQAGKRAKDLMNFLESRRDMFQAASAYSAAVDNFVANADMQFFHYAINASFQVAQMIGSIMQCTGIMAAAGAAVNATAGAAGALEAFLFSARKRYDLEKAWRLYKLALSRPENRKIGLIALKENPTLAKYALAWGAVIKKDPLVSDVLDKCGLDAKSMEDGVTTAKVVSYLETRMADDNVVVGRKFPSADFAPSPIVLTAECWASAKGRGEARAQLKFQDTPRLDLALQRFDALAETIPDKIKEMKKQIKEAEPQGDDAVSKGTVRRRLKLVSECEEAIAECLSLANAVQKGLAAYTPLKVDPNDPKRNAGEHTQMQAVVNDFLDLARNSEEELNEKAELVRKQKDRVESWPTE